MWELQFSCYLPWAKTILRVGISLNLYGGSSIWDDNSNERKMIVVTQIMLFTRRRVSLYPMVPCPHTSYQRVFCQVSHYFRNWLSFFDPHGPPVVFYIHIVFEIKRSISYLIGLRSFCFTFHCFCFEATSFYMLYEIEIGETTDLIHRFCLVSFFIVKFHKTEFF